MAAACHCPCTSPRSSWLLRLGNRDALHVPFRTSPPSHPPLPDRVTEIGETGDGRSPAPTPSTLKP
eukprot:352731-Chlamydomonas_euryale.AAC.6